jgi:hypothetical protein
VQTSRDDRRYIIDLIFGANDLSNSKTDNVFTARLERILKYNIVRGDQFNDYLQKHIIPLLRENNKCKVMKNWSNNNSESLNHVLKHAVDWKSRPLMDLIRRIHNVVKLQYVDLERAVLQEGNYKVSPGYEQYLKYTHEWESMDLTERKEHMYKIRVHRNLFPPKLYITSTNGKLSVKKAPSCGRKPNQVKRKRAERTHNIPRRKKMKEFTLLARNE